MNIYFVGSGSGRVTSSPPGLSCEQSCKASFPSGTTVTLTATPTKGSSIRSWSNGICREQGGSTNAYAGATCTLVISVDTSISVYFDPAPTLNLYFVGSGSGRVTSSPPGLSCEQNCKASFPYATKVTLTATPTKGSAIRSWSNGICREQGSSTNAYAGKTCTLVISVDTSISIYFDPAPTLNLYFVGSGSGRVTSSPPGLSCAQNCKASFPTGAKVTLTAAPTKGSSIRSWSNGICREQGKSLESYAGPKCTFVLAADTSISVYFYPAPTLSVYLSGSGRVTSSPAGISCNESCKATFPSGTRVTLLAAPKAGWTLDGWSSESCGEQGNKLNRYAGKSCTFVMDADRSISLSFVQPPRLERAGAAPAPRPSVPTIGVAVSVAGSGTVVGSGKDRIVCGTRGFRCYAQFPAGTRMVLKAVAAPGSAFVRWSGACSGQAETCRLEANVARDVGASFAAENTQERVNVRLDRPRLRVRWVQGVGGGSLVVSGFVARQANIRIEVRRPLGGAPLTTELRATGAFRYTQTLAPGRLVGGRLVPGGFVVALTGSIGGLRLPLQLRTVVLPAPPEGLVNRAFVSLKQDGRPIRSVPARARQVWANFVFDARPRPGLSTAIRWYWPNGKLLGAVKKPSSSVSVSSFMRGRPRLPTGAWRAELLVGTTVVKQLRVPVGCTNC